jgi:hypothetical protein
LEDIAIYTETGDVPLKEVFKAIFDKENGGVAISHKSSGNDLKKYFEEILPEYDQERVYVSDIKKVMLWYNILHEKEMLDFTEVKEDESTSVEVQENTEEKSE